MMLRPSRALMMLHSIGGIEAHGKTDKGARRGLQDYDAPDYVVREVDLVITTRFSTPQFR
jgi:hypothetical protein